MILDVGLPDGDGRKLAREFREEGITCPIVMLTAADSDSDTIEGLQSGANDYIAKPFRFAVLMARLHAHLRSHGQSEDAVYKVGPYTFRPSAKLLIDAKGKRVRLTEKETNILKFLYRSGETVPRDTLLHEVWGYNPAVTTHTLETHIYRLRQKIETSPGQAQLLVTESGGYRLMP
jgi:DNA-binding response OmpR family regulator